MTLFGREHPLLGGSYVLGSVVPSLVLLFGLGMMQQAEFHESPFLEPMSGLLYPCFLSAIFDKVVTSVVCTLLVFLLKDPRFTENCSNPSLNPIR